MTVTYHCFFYFGIKGQGKIHVESVLQLGIQPPLVFLTLVLPFSYSDCKYFI